MNTNRRILVIVGVVALVIFLAGFGVVTSWRTSSLNDEVVNLKDQIGGSTSSHGASTTDKSFQETSALDANSPAAVFLKGGQVYFGTISSTSDQYIVLTGIFYLNDNKVLDKPGTQSNANVSLVKLGCELHGPKDTMYILKSDVSFWENLKADGQVAKAMSQYKQNQTNATCKS